MPASLADKTHLYQRIVKVKRALEMKGVRVDVRNGEDGTSPSSCYIYDAEEDEEVHVDEMMPSSVIWDAFGATPTASVAPGASVRINPLPTPNRSPAHGDEAPVPDDDIKILITRRIVKDVTLEMKGIRVDVREGEDGTSPSSCYIYDAEEDEEVHVDEMMPSSVIWDAFGATPTASVAPGASVRINPLPTPNRSPAHGDEAPVPDDDIKILITSWRSQRMLRHAHEALDNISRHLARVPGPCRPLHIELILREGQDMINELLIDLSNGELEREYQTALNLHFSLQKELESLQKELEVLQEKGEIGEQDKKCHDLKKRLDLLVHISKDGAQHLEQLTKRARDFRVILEDAVGALARTSRADQADIQHISQKVQVQQQPGMTASGPSASPASSESPSDTTQQQGGAGGGGDPPSQLENEYRKLMGLHFIRVTDEEERQLIEKHIKECHDAGRLDRLVGISRDVEHHLAAAHHSPAAASQSCRGITVKRLHLFWLRRELERAQRRWREQLRSERG
ncbi:unnamed protein product [Vitrella brassicaformis CCMP3155]|uniref:Uncharacterized protein n=1 Tax=Vitrella brassicaformis (strain CCMP3155) TaxID=1169540 RepID=A0A0G4FX46_VITBC|nr:unnamed protein product [Vitrella brassicaformis CCMP3155]|eukprot:CEM19392.1 unnamed protein product [Vitrella brassicaformis CCMP3155]